MVNFSFLVGKGIGPRTRAPVRRAVSTISSVDASIRRWSKAFSRIRIRWFCTVHLLKTAGARGGTPKKESEVYGRGEGVSTTKPAYFGAFSRIRHFSQIRPDRGKKSPHKAGFINAEVCFSRGFWRRRLHPRFGHPHGLQNAGPLPSQSGQSAQQQS